MFLPTFISPSSIRGNGGTGRFLRVVFMSVVLPADRVLTEMEKFLAWFNGPLSVDPLIFSAIAHMWFINIHPFDDGNGRIGRCILDLALAKTEGSPHRFYSLSSQIESDKKNYYRILEITGDGEITDYLSWFIKCYSLAIIHADDQTQHSITKEASTPIDRIYSVANKSY